MIFCVFIRTNLLLCVNFLKISVTKVAKMFFTCYYNFKKNIGHRWNDTTQNDLDDLSSVNWHDAG